MNNFTSSAVIYVQINSRTGCMPMTPRADERKKERKKEGREERGIGGRKSKREAGNLSRDTRIFRE